MRIVDKEESIRWLLTKGISFQNAHSPSFRGLVKAIDFRIPVDSGRKTALSRALASLFEIDDEALLWINEFGIWESCEDRNLFDRFRCSLGEHRPLQEKPGHIFSQSDLTDVTSLLAMILYFVWGAVLYSPAKGLAIEISHDEFILVFAKNRHDATKLAEELKGYFKS